MPMVRGEGPRDPDEAPVRKSPSDRRDGGRGREMDDIVGVEVRTLFWFISPTSEKISSTFALDIGVGLASRIGWFGCRGA